MRLFNQQVNYKQTLHWTVTKCEDISCAACILGTLLRYTSITFQYDYIFANHFHLYSKQAHLAITKLIRDNTRTPPKKATKPAAPMVGKSSPPTGIQSKVLSAINQPRTHGTWKKRKKERSGTYAKATSE